MKRFLMIVLAAAVLLAGCQSGETVKNDVDQKVEEGVNDIGEMTDDVIDKVEDMLGMEDLDEKHTELSGDIAAFAEKVKNSKPTDDKLDGYFTLRKEHDKLDRELDAYEDSLESLYRKDKLKREEYRTRKKALDELDDKLDAAEDDLERAYGIID